MTAFDRRRFLQVSATALLAMTDHGMAVAKSDPAAAGGEDGEKVLGIEELYRLDLLPKLKQSVSVGAVTSYDRSGGNDDGFSGKYSYIRKEPGGLVIADLKGPGIMYRFHTPTPTEDIMEFYFDGESTPRIRLKVSEMFDGTHAPFLSPLVGNGVGGHYSYVPLAYERSLKILVKAEKFYFYDLNFAQYPEDFGISTYHTPVSDACRRHVEQVKKLFAMTGSDITSYLAPPDADIETRTTQQTLYPGQSVTMFEAASPGRIVGLKLSPAVVFQGKARDIILRMYWDGDKRPAVDCPVSDFFGYSWGQPATRSLLVGTTSSMDLECSRNYVYFPMPFEKSARIELASLRTEGPPVEVTAEVTVAAVGKSPEEGRFYALWRRENPTRDGVPYTYLKTTGRGHVVGNILQAQGMKTGSTEFFEGDDVVMIDGKLAVHGTGSEDSFNGGWYDVPGRWDHRASFPLSGCLDYKKELGRTGAYRLMITDTYAYKQSIDYTIEHGPKGNLIPTDYVSVTFFYSEHRPSVDVTLPGADALKVVDPEKITFTPGWNVPIRSTSIVRATLTKETEKIGGKPTFYLRFRGEGKDIFGTHHITFVCDLPTTADYKVGIEAFQGPDQAIVQLFRHDRPVGKAVDLYAAERKLGDVLELGVMKMEEGNNLLAFHLTGKNPKSSGLGLDLVQIVFERVK